jgi:hypothetical protein
MDVSEGHGSSDRVGQGRPEDLRALASLDAMGMLDEVDAAAFDRAFRGALPSVQAELRELQAAVAVHPAFLAGSEEPSPDLKARTLARVMTEVDRDESTLAPIAHIGRTATRPGRMAAAVMDQEAVIAQAIELATTRQDLRRFTRSSYYWRAATIALTAALTVAFVFQVTTRSFAERVAELALGAASTDKLLSTIGHAGAGRDIESADWLRGMHACEGSGLGTGLLAANVRSGQMTVVFLGLEAGKSYELRHVVDGASRTVATFVAARANWTVVLGDIPAADFAELRSGSLELVDPEKNAVMRG